MKTSLEELRTISRNLAREGDFCRAEAIAEAADDLEALQAQLGHMGLQLTTLREELDSAHADDVDPTTADLLKPRGNDGVISPDICFDALLLTGIATAQVDEVEAWSQDQRDRAYDWAMRLHLAASDNDGVFVPAKPDFVREIF